MRRRLRRPAVVIPAAALVLLAAGIGYSAYERVDTSAIEANADLLASVPAYPGARERDRRSDTASTGGLPLPEGVVTTVLYLPPEGATQEGLVDFYVRRLRGWTPRTTTIPASGTGQDAYRVEFASGDDCLTLMTFGMAAGRPGPRTFALAAVANEGGCD